MSLPALRWPEADAPTGLALRSASVAADTVLSHKDKLEAGAVTQMIRRLKTLQASLKARLLADPGSLTDFKRAVLSDLVADTTRLITQAGVDIITGAKPHLDQASELGDSHAEEPIKAARIQLPTPGAVVGLDAAIVQATFENMADLLSQPMQQFRDQIVTSIRRVGVAGDGRFGEIARLREIIQTEGFDNAQYKAERIMRTEISRVFNEATYARLTSLAVTMPFLRKGWRSANDGRTRPTHQAAGRTYARGTSGVIPLADLFVVGRAKLRFPVDPLAQPAGKIAAAETIMCRCNAFVDFDMKDYADHVKQQFSGFNPPEAPPAAPPVVPPALPPAVPLVLPPARAIKPRAPRAPKAIKLKPGMAAADVVHPKAADVRPAPAPTEPQPHGPKVSASLRGIPTVPKYSKIRHAMTIVDQVHGDGNLKGIDFETKAGRARGNYVSARFGYKGNTGKAIGISAAGLKAHPINTMVHEVGHWLDDAVLGTNERWESKARTTVGMKAWKDAVVGSPTIKVLSQWSMAKLTGQHLPDIIVANKRHTEYLLDTTEVWARSYAQYVAVRSKDPVALAELREMQKRAAPASKGEVVDKTWYQHSQFSKPGDKTFVFPNVWHDDEFEPIAKAIDQVLAEHGWRK